MYLWSVCLSQTSPVIFASNINRFVMLLQAHSVLCQTRNESLYTVWINSDAKKDRLTVSCGMTLTYVLKIRTLYISLVIFNCMRNGRVHTSAVNFDSKIANFHWKIFSSFFENKNVSPLYFMTSERRKSRSQWPCGLRRGSAAACLLGFWVRNPPGAWMTVFLCVVRQRSLRRVDHSFWGVLPTVVCLNECGRESSVIRRPSPSGVWCAMVKKR